MAPGGDRAGVTTRRRIGVVELDRAEIGQRQRRALLQVARTALRGRLGDPFGRTGVRGRGRHRDRPRHRLAGGAVAEVDRHLVAADGNPRVDAVTRADLQPEPDRRGRDELVPGVVVGCPSGGAVGLGAGLLERLGLLAGAAQTDPERRVGVLAGGARGLRFGPAARHSRERARAGGGSRRVAGPVLAYGRRRRGDGGGGQGQARDRRNRR